MEVESTTDGATTIPRIGVVSRVTKMTRLGLPDQFLAKSQQH